MRKQLRLSGSGGQGGNVTLHPASAPKLSENLNSSPRLNELQIVGGVKK